MNHFVVEEHGEELKLSAVGAHPTSVMIFGVRISITSLPTLTPVTMAPEKDVKISVSCPFKIVPVAERSST